MSYERASTWAIVKSAVKTNFWPAMAIITIIVVTLQNGGML